jgi:ATP/maltotriose-dependent transcriptional regulator MalT
VNDPQYLTPVIRTKLYRPRNTADWVGREALEAKLEAGVGLPLCVVSAPAGYGKSTLLGHWLETCKLPSAWLSLDLHDNDLRGFLSYFVAAVKSVAQHACPETLKILDADSLPPELVIVSRLSNDLDHLDERFILVLDDYDRIREPAIHSLLDQLLEHPLPGSCSRVGTYTEVSPRS